MRRGDLSVLVAAAANARPQLDREAFARHLETVAPAEGKLAIDDLALAFQAATGEASATRELQQRLEQTARPALTAAGYESGVADDAIQETSIQLLVGSVNRARPLLLTYQGRASIGSWMKTIALRTASRLVKISRRTSGDDSALQQLASVVDPAAAIMKAELRQVVRRAYAAAVRRLSYFHRELLAAVVIEGRTIDDLSRQYDVHRATAARWVGRASAALDGNLRRELGQTLALEPSEVSSVLTAVASSIELTPGRLLDGVPK